MECLQQRPGSETLKRSQFRKTRPLRLMNFALFVGDARGWAC